MGNPQTRLPRWRTTQICNPPSEVTSVNETCPRCGKGWKRTYTVGVNFEPYCGRCRQIVKKLRNYEEKLEKLI